MAAAACFRVHRVRLPSEPRPALPRRLNPQGSEPQVLQPWTTRSAPRSLLQVGPKKPLRLVTRRQTTRTSCCVLSLLGSRKPPGRGLDNRGGETHGNPTALFFAKPCSVLMPRSWIRGLRWRRPGASYFRASSRLQQGAAALLHSVRLLGLYASSGRVTRRICPL